MFGGFDNDDPTIGDNRDVLEELERSTSEQIRRAGVHFRVRVKSKVTVRPGNVNDPTEVKNVGVSAELTDISVTGVFPAPLCVGDVYRVYFDRATLDLPMMFGRCVRCRFIQEEAYEGGLEFFTPVVLPESLTDRKETPI